MKKFAFLQILFLWLLPMAQVQAQEYFLNPTSMVNSNANTDIPLFVCPTFDVDAMIAEDQANDTLGLSPSRFAKGFDVGLSTDKDGVWETIDSVQVWRQKISSDGAYSMMATLENINIPEKSSIFIYNDDMSYVMGPLQYNVNQYGVYTSELIPGSSLTIELVIEGKVETGVRYFTITEVAHDYYDFFALARDITQFGKKIPDCMDQDINCPSHNGWWDQKRSVALMVGPAHQNARDRAYCTGAFINNTSNDGKPLFLTASHCFTYLDAETKASKTTFYFNYESKNCNNRKLTPYNYWLNGSTVRSRHDYTDYILLEVNGRLPSSYYPYFAGWDKTGTDPNQATGIHHPNGNLKKIAEKYNTFTSNPDLVQLDLTGDPLRQYVYLQKDAAWELSFDLGGTTRGSSGSPLFNENKKLIGQLSGGQLTCGGTIFYGRLSVGWNYGLKKWLDPLGTDPDEIVGYTPAGWRNDWLIGWNQPVQYKMYYNIKSLATGANAIYYRGMDNKMQMYYFGNNGWLHDWVRGVNVPNSELIGGDVVVGEADQLFYVGADNKVHTYYKTQNGWMHGWLTSSISISNENVSSAEGSLAVGHGNQIFYRGTDNKMHTYYWTQSGWQHNWIVSNAPSSENIAGDVVVGKQGGLNQVFYRGSDGKMHTYWYNNATSKWVHAKVLDSAPRVSTVPGSIAVGSENDLYYRGTDNHMYRLYYETGMWKSMPMSNNQQSNQKVSGDITFSPGQIFYRGADGKMHIFWYHVAQGEFIHDWIETSWQAPTRNNISGAIEASPDGQIYYRGTDGLVRVYFWGSEMMQRPENGSSAEPEKNSVKPAYLADLFNISAYPNPTKDKLALRVESSKADTYTIFITDLSGRLVYTVDKILTEGSSEIELPIFSTLSSGTYIITIVSKNNNTSKELKIIKSN